MEQQQFNPTHQATLQNAPHEPTPLVQSESATVIFAIAFLISVLMSGITRLMRVLVMTRSYR